MKAIQVFETFRERFQPTQRVVLRDFIEMVLPVELSNGERSELAERLEPRVTTFLFREAERIESRGLPTPFSIETSVPQTLVIGQAHERSGEGWQKRKIYFQRVAEFDNHVKYCDPLTFELVVRDVLATALQSEVALTRRTADRGIDAIALLTICAGHLKFRGSAHVQIKQHHDRQIDVADIRDFYAGSTLFGHYPSTSLPDLGPSPNPCVRLYVTNSTLTAAAEALCRDIGVHPIDGESLANLYAINSTLSIELWATKGELAMELALENERDEGDF